MKLLIEYKDNIIRNDFLQVEQKYDYYSINSYSEKDKESGTPCFWNQLVITGIFRDYVIENVERFEYPHLLILHSIIINQDFNENESESWIN